MSFKSTQPAARVAGSFTPGNMAVFTAVPGQLEDGGAPGVGGGTSSNVVQVVNTMTGAMATGTTVIPADNTIPQITEGTEFMTLAITPTSATNKLIIDVVFVGSCATANRSLTVALFQDATANALACVPCPVTSALFTHHARFSYYMTAGTTSSTTFRIRAGVETSGTVTFNGSNGAAFWGGVLASSITITEVIPTAGGAPTLDGLGDVTITSAAAGHELVYNGSGWVNQQGWNQVTAAANQTVNNSTALVDDNELRFDMAAGGMYVFEGFIAAQSPLGAGTPDFKLTFTGPATLTGIWSAESFFTAGGTATGAVAVALGSPQAFNSAATPTGAKVTGWCLSSAGGTGASGFRMQFAENTLNANDLTRLAGSFLRYRRVL